MLEGILIAACAVVVGRVVYCAGYKAGVDYCMEARRNQEIGAVCERWKGHVTHRGHTIQSPIQQEGQTCPGS